MTLLNLPFDAWNIITRKPNVRLFGMYGIALKP